MSATRNNAMKKAKAMNTNIQRTKQKRRLSDRLLVGHKSHAALGVEDKKKMSAPIG